RDAVAILGGGVSGLLHLLAARAAGAGPIVVIEPSDPRRAAALRLGADAALPPGREAVEAALRAAGGRVDHVIVCTGARAAFEQALELAGPGATISLFAPLEPGEVLPLPVAAIWKRGVRLVPSYAGPPEEMRAALDLIASGRIDVAALVTHRLPLERIGEGFRLAAEGGETLKVLIEP
ncbi:MAG: alcohol dehydrogenase, partial [Acidobacteria bacterium]